MGEEAGLYSFQLFLRGKKAVSWKKGKKVVSFPRRREGGSPTGVEDIISIEKKEKGGRHLFSVKDGTSHAFGLEGVGSFLFSPPEKSPKYIIQTGESAGGERRRKS